ncbi:Gfo/Idh/MocA family protein [Paenibacillus sp. NPDC058071]|uniref:Gfo/Idh/MocA family protein n=1 Tax=Paenibacillus sp. NPDC058071 TaxID=3346326 RepID=UPI0036DC00E6
MDRRLRLGIVGFGRIVELIHLPLLKKLPAYEVCGIYDMTPERRSLAEKRGFSAFDSLERLFEQSLDAVLVATPPSSHYSIAREALLRGLHVLIEKPVTQTAEESERLLALEAQTGKSVTVFHNRRFDPDFLLVRHVLAEGWLGDILFVERRHHMFGSGASFGVKSFRPEWRNEAKYGGGALLDWGVHLVDQLLRLELGDYERLVSAGVSSLRWQQGDVEDFVNANFQLHNGIQMLFEVNFGSHAAAPFWIVGGDKATLQVMPNNEALIYEKGKTVRKVEIPPGVRPGPEMIYASFADCLLQGAKPAVTLAEAAQTMKILEAVRDASAITTKGL